MRLLECDGSDIRVTKDFVRNDQIPPYAILSHTWGDNEVVFRDFDEGLLSADAMKKVGFDKIRFCGRQAERNGLRYFWVDTCCIDRSNSTEVQEAINSMFRWYKRSVRCYAYLSDVSVGGASVEDLSADTSWHEEFVASKWFTRGWTLQELIAPNSVELFSRDWRRLGDKSSLEPLIVKATEIPAAALRGTRLSEFSVDERFRWAAGRSTLREEDQAYALLGIFGIHVPLIYGEGREGAMRRLREEINKPSIAFRSGLQWLSPADFVADYNAIIGQRFEGTGQWFLDSPEFQSWASGRGKTLFCPGMPGAGKTMMAATAIEHVLSRDDVGLAYIFCRYKSQADQGISNLLASLLRDLAQRRQQATATVSFIKRCFDERSRPTVEELYDTLKSVCASYSAVYIVIDALDECDDRRGDRSVLIDKLMNLQAERNINVLFTSRPLPEVEQRFSTHPRLEIFAHKADVLKFVEGQIPRLSKCIQRNDELQRTAKEKIVDAVDGMFLLARLHVDSLLDKWTRQEVLTMLEKMSAKSTEGEALDQAYGEAIRRIDEQRPGARLLARRVLSWITFAQRPLATTELCVALAVRMEDEVLNSDNLYDAEDLVSVCAGLVRVDGAIIRLVHYTTQEYLEGVCCDWEPNVRLEIATVCLRYLSLQVFTNGMCTSGNKFRQRLSNNPFFDYTARHWADHVRTVEHNTEVLNLALTFVGNQALVDSALQVALSDPGFSWTFPRNNTALHLTARYKLPHLTAIILGKRDLFPIDINSEDSNGQTALLLAAGNGQTKIVKLLLDAGATPNEYEAILTSALRNRPGSTVTLDTKVTFKTDMKGDSALLAAVRSGHDAAASLLLRAMTCVAAARVELEYAARKGIVTTVKKHFQRTANLAIIHEALQTARNLGHTAIVDMLLEPVKTKGPAGGKALTLTTDRPSNTAPEQPVLNKIFTIPLNDTITVKTLVAGGATPDAALYGAAKIGDVEVIRLLLKAGAKANIIYARNTPLGAAAFFGHMEVVKQLLDAGAKADFTEIWSARERGHQNIVDILESRLTA